MGSVDNLWVMVSFFAIAIIVIMSAVFWNLVTTQTSELFDNPTGQQVLSNTNNAVNLFDFILFLGYIGVHLGIIITSFFLKSHPVGLILVIFLMVILVIVAVPISNTYSDMVEETVFDNVNSDFPITHNILLYLPILEVVWSVLNGIILYGFSSSEML
jgi:hypothetical protein